MNSSIVLVLISVVVTAGICALIWRRPSRHADASRCVTANTVERAERGWTRIADLDDDLIETILTLHYRDVLRDPVKQKMWRRLLREASAVRTVQGLGG